MDLNPAFTNDDELYHEELLDLYKHPHNEGVLTDPSFVHEEQNPLCGDVITLCVQLDETQRVTDLRFRGQGCAISQASASLFTDFAKGKTLQEIVRLTPEQVQQQLGVRLSPTRLKCALLVLRTFQNGKKNYLETLS